MTDTIRYQRRLALGKALHTSWRNRMIAMGREDTTGCKMPEWEELSMDLQDNYCNDAAAVIQAAIELGILNANK